MGLDPADPLLQLLRRSGAEVAGFGQLDEIMQRRHAAGAVLPVVLLVVLH